VAEGNGGDESGAAAAPKPQPRPQTRAPIGGMVSDPRDQEVKTGPSLTAFLRDRVSTGIQGALVFIGVRRPRNPDGTLGPRSWKRLFAFLATVFAIAFVWTSIHIVQPGTVAVPVTLGHAGDPIGPGFHITLPFTTTYAIPVRVQNYTMSFIKGEGAAGNADDSVAVLGSDGGAANVNATVLYRVDPRQATTVYKNIGKSYATTIVRPTARFCIRTQFTLYPLIAAATTDFRKIQSDAAQCFKDAVQPQGLIVQDFQLREVALSSQLQSAVNSKVASQQNAEQQKFELATAQQGADITRIQALATADSQQILACGGKAETVRKNGVDVQTVVPNALTACSQSQLTPAYLQYTYIQALKQLVTSNNATTIILPFDKNLTPLINIPNGSSTNGASSNGSTTTPTKTGP
jgi:regulator of protease activity HflC (stomatin/prohibitin superfamily)